MKPLIVLLGSYLLIVLISKLLKKRINYQLAGRFAMALMLLFTAIGHFIYTNGMTAMIPDFLPYQEEIVISTGFLEIAFAIGLLFPRYKKMTAWAIILFLLFVLPANIKASIDNIDYQTGVANGPGLLYLWFRIPLQIFFILWVYFSAIKKTSSDNLKLAL